MLPDISTPKIFKMERGEWTLVCYTIYSVLGNIVEKVLVSTPKLLPDFNRVPSLQLEVGHFN